MCVMGNSARATGGPYLHRCLLIGKALSVYWPHSWDQIPGTPIPFPLFPNIADMRSMTGTVFRVMEERHVATKVCGLVKSCRRRVVDGVDFEVDPGEIVGLLGPNGAGNNELPHGLRLGRPGNAGNVTVPRWKNVTKSARSLLVRRRHGSNKVTEA